MIVPSKHILVLDDDASRRQLNVFGLRCAGFAVHEAPDTDSARNQIARRCPHLLLICVALLEPCVQDFVKQLRDTAETSELAVTVLAEEERKRDGRVALACGVNDFLAQPISPEEFIARIETATHRTDAAIAETSSLAGLQFNAERSSVRRDDQEVLLGPTEARVLEFFMSHAGQVIPRGVLVFRVWGGRANVTRRAVDVSVCRLRRALQHLGCEDLLQTVNRRGYRLSPVPSPVDWRRAEQLARREEEPASDPSHV